jgi:hypothetical protein
MKMSQKNIILLFILFLSIGLICGYSFDFIQNDKALSLTFKWFTIPTFILSAFYGYKLSFGFNEKVSFWKNTLQLILAMVLFGLMFLKSFQGYLILYNTKFGKQEKIIVKGQVKELKFPKNKKLLNNYSIIIRTEKNEIITLDVPTKNYYIGQIFEKEMFKGSLGFLYSSK